MVVTITVELAMDHKPSHRELASVLISDLYQKVISQRDIGKGMKDKMIVQLSRRYFSGENKSQNYVRAIHAILPAVNRYRQ